jgi:hypothetical protein
MIDGKDSGGGFALVEHRLAPHILAAPLHLHTREDEYSYVLEGTLGALLGDHEVVAEPGTLVVKPAASGTPSGMPARGRPGSWRSSPPRALRSCFASSRRPAANSTRRRSRRWPLATARRWTSSARWRSSSGTA